MKPGMISRELLGLLQTLMREVAEDQQEAFLTHATNFLRPILQPTAQDVHAAKQYAFSRIEVPEWLTRLHERNAARAREAKRDQEGRQRYEREHNERLVSHGYQPQYGDQARQEWRKRHTRRKEYDDA
jgi:hypothetical protein